MFDIGKESHLKFSILINLKKFLKALLEDRVTKRVCHYVVTSSPFKACFHLQNTNLVNSSDEKIYYYPCSLGSL